MKYKVLFYDPIFFWLFCSFTICILVLALTKVVYYIYRYRIWSKTNLNPLTYKRIFLFRFATALAIIECIIFASMLVLYFNTVDFRHDIERKLDKMELSISGYAIK